MSARLLAAVSNLKPISSWQSSSTTPCSLTMELERTGSVLPELCSPWVGWSSPSDSPGAAYWHNRACNSLWLSNKLCLKDYPSPFLSWTPLLLWLTLTFSLVCCPHPFTYSSASSGHLRPSPFQPRLAPLFSWPLQNIPLYCVKMCQTAEWSIAR